MTTPDRRYHPYRRTREEDLHLLATGRETGWWDDNGHPAPWPDDFLDPKNGWTTDPDPNNPADIDDPENPPF